MSSFVVGDETINRVTTFLFRDKDSEWDRRKLVEQFPDFGTPEKLGEAMYKLNLAAVEDRYGEYAAGQMCDLEYTWRYELGSKVQVLKSLRCWLYQCMEGEIEKDPLYEFMEQFAGSVAYDIVRATDEYEAAVWG